MLTLGAEQGQLYVTFIPGISYQETDLLEITISGADIVNNSESDIVLAIPGSE